MRLHRFYIEADIAVGDSIVVSPEQGADQWRKVFHMVSGDKLLVFNGFGSTFLCELQGYVDKSAKLAVLEETFPQSDVSQHRETWLCAAIVKKDTFEWIVEKATELGVSRIIPIVAERSEKKNLNMGRLQKIIIESAEQSGRVTLPKIDAPIDELLTFSEALLMLLSDANISPENIIAWDPQGDTFTPAVLQGKNKVISLVGPEGGWSPSELALLKEKGIATYSMGSQILRAETAVVAGLSLLTFL